MKQFQYGDPGKSPSIYNDALGADTIRFVGSRCGTSALQAPDSSTSVVINTKIRLREGGKETQTGKTEKQGIGDMDDAPLSKKKPGTPEQNKSYRTFRSLITTLPSLRPLLHKVVALVDSHRIPGESAVSLGTPLFEAFPPAVFFVGFKSAGVYDAVVRLRNKDRFSRRVHAVIPDSVNFSVTSLKERQDSTAVAPGMSASFVVTFHAGDASSYAYDLLVETERETFLIPLRAFQGLCSIDLPPIVSLGTATVGKRGEKTFLITNTGTAASSVSLFAPSPFGAQPDAFFLPVGSKQQVVFTMESSQCGNFEFLLKIQYDDGREETRQLQGKVCESAVLLSASTIEFDRTFVNLTCERSICIENNSDEHLTFLWSFGPLSKSLHLMETSKEVQVKSEEELELITSGPFCIKPASGRVWAKSKRKIRLEFTPGQATTYSATAICSTAGREQGLKLQLQGVGTGPQAKFTREELNFGEVVVYAQKTLDVDIVNMGDIAASFAVKPFSEVFSSSSDFSFSPSSGCINVNKAERVQAVFRPTFIGKFEVKVLWSIESSPEDIVLTLKGNAIPPQFKLDVSSLEFGVIPFGFDEVRKVTLTNTSDADQKVKAKVLWRNDETYNDITIKPEEMLIPAGDSRQLEIILRPSKAQTYIEEITIDLPGFKENLFILPLRGSSKTPQVALEPDATLVFEDVFVHTPARRTFTIRNTSPLSAQFSVVFEPGTNNVDIEATPPRGLVAALSTADVLITLRPLAPGDIRLTCSVNIAGLETPFDLQLCACASGPKLKVDPKELQWGKITCLDEVARQIEITNISPIPALIRCSIKSKHGYFVVQSPELTLEGGASTAITVVAAFAEAVSATDRLIISVVDGQDMFVILRGQAVGSPVVLKSFESSIDFQQVCTSVAKCKSFSVINRGIRARQIMFLDGSRSTSARQASATQPKFLVKPSEFLLGPDMSKTVEIEAFSTFPGRASQVIFCHESMGPGVTPLRIARTLAMADFFTPALIATPSSLSFKHVWRPDNEREIIRAQVALSNESPIVLRCNAKASPPFDVEPKCFFVEPQGETSLNVSFYTYFNGRHSSRTKGVLEISFREHPRTDVIPLEAQSEFPNIELETNLVDFGVIVNETTKRIPLLIRNNSCVPVTYGWSLSDACSFKSLEIAEDTELLSVEGVAPVHKIFDFTPFTGELEPGASDTVYIRYWGLPNRKVSAVAICSVSHGPEYPVRLIGGASYPRLKVSQTEFNFGEVPFLKAVTATVVLMNCGFVDLEFAVDLERINKPWTIDVPKRKGVVRANETLKLDVRFMAGVPTDITEQLFVEIDHCDPISITLRAKGTYPCLLVNLPRIDEAGVCQEPSLRAACTSIDDETTITVLQNKAEIDRQNLCKLMLEHYKAAVPSASKVGVCTEDALNASREEESERMAIRLSSCSSIASAFAANQRLWGDVPAITVTPGRYLLDFGSVIVCQSKRKVVQLRNASPHTFGIKINKKSLTGTGFNVEPDVINRLQSNEHSTLAITASQEKEGEAIFPLTMYVSGSLTYQILLKAKFVVPDLQFSTESLDFGGVKRGLRKTLRLRIRNGKSVPAQWRYRATVDKGDKVQSDALQCFAVEPKQSVVFPGEWLDLKVHFFPEKTQKEVCARLVFCIDDNSKWKCIVATGAPKLPSLEFLPPLVEFGHCLPLHMLRHEVIVRNNSDDPCELYSIEFDEQYKQTNAFLRHFDGFDDSGIALLPVRPPGKICWSRVRKAAMRKAVADGLLQQELDAPALKAENASIAPSKLRIPPSEVDAEEFQGLESSSDESCDECSQEFPNRVLPPNRQSAIIVGPVCSGKRCVAAHLGAGMRRLLTLDECVEWAVAASGKKKKLEAAGAHNRRLVEELIRQFEAQDGDGDATSSKKIRVSPSDVKTKAGRGDRRGETTGQGIALQLLTAAVKVRVAQPDCYAGTVFRIEPSAYCLSVADGALAITRGLEQEDLVIITIKFGRPECVLQEGESASSSVSEGVTFYRGLLAKQLQREREILEVLDGKGPETTGNSRLVGSASGMDSRKKRTVTASEGESRQAAVHLSDEEAESYRQELHSVQRVRQRIEGYMGSSRAAQAFVQEQIVTYSSAESELLKEFGGETGRAAVSSGSGSGRRGSRKSSLGITQRLIAFSTGYANSALPIDSLLAQIQHLREPVIPAEPPIPQPELFEVVHYPPLSPVIETPTKFIILSPLACTTLDKLEDEEMRNKPKKAKEATPVGSARSRVKQDKAAEEDCLAVRLAVEPGFTKTTRWILEPHGEQRLLLKCFADEEGDIACTLHFGVVGDSEPFRLYAKATCSLPRLVNFPQGCFDCAIQERIPNQTLKKAYVVNEGTYDWGPLLPGRSAAFVKSLYSKGVASDQLDAVLIPPELSDFMTVLVLRNGSLYTTAVKGSFAGGLGSDGGENAKGRKIQKSQIGDPTFLLFPSEVTLAKNATACMHLWCLPKGEGEIGDKLILMLSDNPNPFEVKLSSRGVAPQINLHADSLAFGRILTGTSARQMVEIENPTPFLVRWSFAYQETPAKCFTFNPEKSGILDPFSTHSLEISYEAPLKPAAAQCRLMFKCTDAEGIAIGSEIKVLTVLAEAFSIDAGIELPSKTHVLDFGKVQAYQDAEIPFTVYNKGKYAVHFDFEVSSPMLKNLLTLEPGSGEVKPGEQRKGIARLSAKQEVELVGTEDIAITFTDSETCCSLTPPSPRLQVMAVMAFNEVSLSPLRGLNFGPVESGKTSTLTFELENKGRFAFEWYLVNQESMFSPPDETIKSPDGPQKGEKQKPAKSKPQGKSAEKGPAATFGHFKIVPIRGQLDPGSKMPIQVEYNAQGDASHALCLALLVNGVKMGHGEDTSVSSVGPVAAFFADPLAPIDYDTYGPVIPAATYLVQGQSSVPSISLEPEKLFQDQVIVRSMDDAQSIWHRRSTTVFVEEENCLCFGPVIVSETGSTGGIVETIRVENPQIIPAEIVFEIKQAVKAPHEKNQQAVDDSGFDVQPRRIMLAPHDYAYVTLTFNPAALQQYCSYLQIFVEKASNPLVAQAQFELRGEGTLPTITLAFPISVFHKSANAKSHVPFFDFGRVAESRAVTVPVVIKNEGVVPATARAVLPPCSSIDFDLPLSLTLQPKEERTFALTYRPRAPGELDYRFRIATQANPFESVDVQIKGVAISEELIWSLVSPVQTTGLQSDFCELVDGNNLVLNEVPLGEIATQALALRNVTSQAIYFELNAASLGQLKEALTITPSAGSIAANATCLMNLSFKSEEPLSFVRHAVVFSTGFLQGSDLHSGISKPLQKSKGKNKTKQMDSKSDGMAQDKADQHSLEELVLYVTAATDIRRCELNVSKIHFEETVLFKKRVFFFTISNISAVSLPFELFFENDNERDEPCFYELSVTRGCIPGGGQQKVQISFSPRDILNFERVLVCCFPNLRHGFSTTSVHVSASAIRPICHIEMPPTDYLERRSQSATLAIDDQVAVLELEGVGVGVRYTRRVYVHNPTAHDLDFECEAAEKPAEDAAPFGNGTSPFQPFKCLTRRGRILAGKKIQLVFEYTPTQLGICERLWTFFIPSKQLTQRLLLVGRAREPHVVLEKGRIVFPPTIIGRKVEETIRLHNRECIPVSFQFDRAQIDAPSSDLKLTPHAGTVGPESSVQIKVEMSPMEEKKINETISCKVIQKLRPLRLDINGEGYYLKPSLKLLDKDSERTLQSDSEEVHFGCLLAGQTKQVMLRVGNYGKYDFSFRWIMTAPKCERNPRCISIQPADGLVPKGQTVDCVALYAPDAPTATESLQAICEVQGEKVCKLLLTGSCKVPKVSFSFTTHDFGSLFVASAAEEPYDTLAVTPRISSRVVLKITNAEPHHECTISSTCSSNSVFDFQPMQVRLSPEEVLEVPINFSPREVRLYKAKIPFFVNDRLAATVQLSGRGVPIRLEVQSIENKIIKFQPVLRGKSSAQTVHIFNHSEKPLSFYLKSSDGQLSSKGVSWRPSSSPSSLLQLLPKQSIGIEFFFRPTAACQEFYMPLLAECFIKSIHGVQAVPVYLCSICGKCFETEVRLRPPSVAFGSVVVGSWATQEVLLSNVGELPMKFRFANTELYPDMVSISPSHGTLQPQANLSITVTFRPTRPTEELEIEDILCFGNAISGPKDPPTEVARLPLIATGRGVALPADALHVLKFATNVRSPVTKTFYLKNTKKVEWMTTPHIAMDCPRDVAYFSCQPSGPITIPPNQKVALQLTYLPLKMTLESGSQDPCISKAARQTLPAQHSATMFCALPGGEACCVRMIGTASEPSVEQVTEAVATCKQQTAVNLKIKNWLVTKQMFNVSFTVLQPAGGHGIDLQAPAFLEIPGSQIREYRFFVSALKPCNAVVQFRFTNTTTGDFSLTEACIQFNEKECMGIIHFEGTSRQSCRHRLGIENPSGRRASFQCTSTHQDISFIPQPFVIPPQSTGVLNVLMRPTLPERGEASVLLVSEELGAFKYLVQYDIRSPGVEKRITLSAPLGRDAQQSVRFLHFGKKATVYQLSLEWPGDSLLQQKTANLADVFVFDSKGIQVPADLDNQGVEICIPIRFVPSRLQETKAILCVRGAEGQEYRALLVGRATAPEAQGPLKVPKGKGLAIDFKNPMDSPTEFTAQVDQAAFSLDKKSFRLEARRSIILTVSLRNEARACGRLIVAAEGLPPWIIYLKTE